MSLGPAASSRLRVLVAEDETIIRLDVCSLLRASGFEVCGEARDGIEAVGLARECEPDVAILDVKMPNLDGIEAARRICAERPIPVVLLTAFSERALVRRAIEAGIAGYLVKPFKETDVVPAILTAVARHGELVEARRELGARPPRPLDLTLHSPTGEVWPLRLGRLPDGRTEITLPGARRPRP